MLNQTQVINVSLVVTRYLEELCSEKFTPKEIAVTGKMLCEALSSMQDEVRFHAIKLPTKAEGKEFFDSIGKVVFTDTAPEDKFVKGEGKRICPRCENEENREDH